MQQPARCSKGALKPWRQQQWSIPPPQNSEFVARMEDILMERQFTTADARIKLRHLSRSFLA
jgi:hypothetical protein